MGAANGPHLHYSTPSSPRAGTTEVRLEANRQQLAGREEGVTVGWLPGGKHCDVTLQAHASMAVLGIWPLREAVPSECGKGRRAVLTEPRKGLRGRKEHGNAGNPSVAFTPTTCSSSWPFTRPHPHLATCCFFPVILIFH